MKTVAPNHAETIHRIDTGSARMPRADRLDLLGSLLRDIYDDYSPAIPDRFIDLARRIDGVSERVSRAA